MLAFVNSAAKVESTRRLHFKAMLRADRSGLSYIKRTEALNARSTVDFMGLAGELGHVVVDSDRRAIDSKYCFLVQMESRPTNKANNIVLRLAELSKVRVLCLLATQCRITHAGLVLSEVEHRPRAMFESPLN